MAASPRPSQIIIVGQKIRQIRKSRRLTQAELAARIGVTQSDLSRMENGEYKVGLDTLFRTLQVFELSMSSFFEEPVSEVSDVEDATAAEGTSEIQVLLAEIQELDEDSRREVRDFVAFKRVQQQSRQSRWRPEPGLNNPAPAPKTAGPLIPFGRPAGSSRAE